MRREAASDNQNQEGRRVRRTAVEMLKASSLFYHDIAITEREPQYKRGYSGRWNLLNSLVFATPLDSIKKVQ